MSDRTIPLPVITVVAEALKDTYSESKLRGLFLAAGIGVPDATRMTKVEFCMACLALANKEMPDPLATLGAILGDLMDRNVPEDDAVAVRQQLVVQTLANHQYAYMRGGTIGPNGLRIANVLAALLVKPSDSSGTKPTPTPRAEQTAPKEVGREGPPQRSTLFIGSTVEALPIARAVHSELDHDLEVTIWNHGLFPANVMTWSQLLTKATEFDFALFVFSGDDHVVSRGQESLGVRDNVLIEYGLFVGVLGHQRVFFMTNRSLRPRIASDLAGVTPLTYADREDKNLRAAVSPAADDIRQTAIRLGRRSGKAR